MTFPAGEPAARPRHRPDEDGEAGSADYRRSEAAGPAARQRHRPDEDGEAGSADYRRAK